MEDMQRNIVQKSAELFLQFGIRSVSIDNVCSELRISKKTFYNYFSQKEDLIEAVLIYQEETIFHKLKKLLNANTAIDSLIIIVKEIKKAIEGKSPAFYYDLKKYYTNLYVKYEDGRLEQVNQWFISNLKQGIKEGYYRDDMDIELVALYHTIGMGSSLSKIQEKTQGYSKKRLMEFYIDMMMHFIANEKGLKYFKEHYNSNDS